MNSFRTSPEALAHFHQARATLAQREREQRAAEAVHDALREAPSGLGFNGWNSRAHLVRLMAGQARREARWAMPDAFAPVLADLLGVGPWRPAASTPRALSHLLSTQEWDGAWRIIDHVFPFRRAGARGRPAWCNTVVLTQPYYGASVLARGIDAFLRLPHAHGLRVQVLPRDWNWHARDIGASQVLLVGACNIVPARLT